MSCKILDLKFVPTADLHIHIMTSDSHYKDCVVISHVSVHERMYVYMIGKTIFLQNIENK